MAKFVSDLDINQNQIKNGRFESLASDPSTGNFEGRLFYNSTEKVIKWRTDAGVRKALHAVTSSTTALTSSESNGSISLTIADATGSVSGLLSAANFTLLTGATSANTANAIVRRDANGDFAARNITAAIVTGLSDPVNGTDAANKNYVDAARSGLDVKASVRVATTGPGTLASSFANGQVVDGVTLATGDRILIKDQATGSENGIYTVNASGAPTRSTDADSNTEVTAGMFTFVEQGTANADSGWVITNDGAITLGTTALTFVQFSGAGQITAGAGLTKTGNTLNVGAGTGITVNADDIQISASYAGQTSIVTLGTVTTGTWSASTILANRGGTGQSSYTVGDLLYADTSTTLAKLAGVATGNALISGGTGTAPSWGKIGLTTHVSGTLAIGNGGTGSTSFTTNGVVLGGATLSSTAAGTANQVFVVPGAGGAPQFGSVNLASSSAVGSSILPLANGGTNASTAAGARTNLDVPRKYKSVVPSGSTTATITHNLGTADVLVQVYEISSGITVYADVTRTNTNTITIGFSVAPSANQYQAIIIAVE
jgi:hypothetical protein